MRPWAARGPDSGSSSTPLGLSVATAKSHVGRLLTELGARDRVQLVIAAYEAGLVTLGAS